MIQLKVRLDGLASGSVQTKNTGQTMLNCIDNSGATVVECIANIKMKRHARIGILLQLLTLNNDAEDAEATGSLL